MKATARIKRIISHSAIALALGCAVVQPASAQLTTIDPAHIGMQLGQWVQNAASWVKEFEQWKEQFTQWKNQMISKLGLNMTDAAAGTSESRRAEFKEAIAKIRDGGGCSKIKYDSGASSSKALCKQEQGLKAQRAERVLKVMDDSADLIKQLDTKVKEYNTYSTSGTKDDSNEGKMRSLEADIAKLQADISRKFAEADADIKAYNTQIDTIHGVRVDVAKIQIEGQEPSLVDKLITSTVTAATLGATDSSSETAALKSKNKY